MNKGAKVISEFHIGEYVIPGLDEKSYEPYTHNKIDEDDYEPVPLYDIPNAIAIASRDRLTGKTVSFV